MTKFTSEEKMNAVIHYQDGSEGIKSIAESLGANYEKEDKLLLHSN